MIEINWGLFVVVFSGLLYFGLRIWIKKRKAKEVTLGYEGEELR